ncbi:MAG: LLM class flavin-dependent oxidoreductase [Alphaproteobacteria bacterium]|nr:LLM class flavin-dependent oxidoreductase [Alphaproteobacteria bacterium]
MTATAPLFGWMMGAVGEDGASDAELYRNMMSDADLGYALGYDAPWIVEHHFSNYYPTPSPMIVLSHIAARYPDFGLGTAVIVTPWHHPLRIAEEIAMLSLFSEAPLRIGLGRGMAPLEYEAFGISLFEAKDRFEEIREIIRLALRGRPFTYAGKHYRIDRETILRPTPRMNNVSFFGAISQPSSAGKIADLELQPMMTGQAPLEEQRAILDAWSAATLARGGNADALKVVSPILIMADTDREALELAREYVPRWFKLQVEHYAADEKLYGNVPSYASFAETFRQRVANCNPDNLGRLFEVSLIGSAETVCARLQRFLDVGYNYVMIQPSLPGMPHHIRQDWLTRFGRDVMPKFGAQPRQRLRTVSRLGAAR